MNNNVVLLIARILLAIIFIVSGVGKFGDIAGTAGYIASKGLPASTLLAWATPIFEVVAGAAIVVGFQTRLAAYAIAAFCVLAAVIFHTDFSQFVTKLFFMKDLAIAGGFLALSVAGAGNISVDAKRG